MIWQRLFTPWILERGRNYRDDGCVTRVHQDENTVTAVVSGTEDYDVQIEMSHDGEILHMSCSCPYAQGGDNCKHMAAVLFAIEKGGLEQSDILRKDEGFSELPWQEALNQLSPEEMRKLLSALAQSDRGLQEWIASLHDYPAPDAQKATWEAQLAEIPEKYADCYGYIDYDYAYDFFLELDAFLDTRLPRLLETERILEAFSLSCMVFETGMEQNVDDSDGGQSALAASCEEVWQTLLTRANSQQEREMYTWFASHTKTPAWDYGTVVVEQFLFEWKWSTPLLKQNLQLLDAELAGDGNDEYRMEELLDWRADTMAALGVEKAAIDRFWAQYRHFPFVREREINHLLDEKSYDDAIRLLKESKELDKEDNFRVRSYSQKLILIYQQTGQTELLREELRFQIFSCDQRDLTYIKQYREIMPAEDWPALLDALLHSPTTRTLYYELLAFGEQYESLFLSIVRKGSFQGMCQYADILCRWSPEQVRDAYVQMLDEVMSCSSDRNMYREAIGYLERVRQFPNGEEEANRLSDSWRMRFGRRRAMLDELRKAGY